MPRSFALQSPRVDPVSELENALGAELLRAKLLHQPPPTLAHRYTVETVLGRGASGLVVAAVDVRLNRPVALKVRPVEGDSTALAEARTLARLDHPNVVRVHDVDIVRVRLDGRDFHVWIVSMPRLEGRTMRAWLREQDRTPMEVLLVLIDVGRGLAAAHAEQIIHRDVKPDNIIVRSDGVAQVLDFGFAVQAASAQSMLGGTRPAAGTDPYMAPEARLGRTSRASDQFSLGVTLVEALSGTPMPAGTRAPRGAPPAVWRIAQRATAPDPDERFADLTAMVEEMTRASRAPSKVRLLPVVVAGLLGAAAVVVIRSEAWEATGHAGHEVRNVPSTRVSETGLGTTPGTERSATPADTAAEAAAPPSAAAPVQARDASPIPTSSADAGAPQGPAQQPDAGVTRCVYREGLYQFRTIVAPSGSGSPMPPGTYTMGLETRRGRVRAVSLRRTAPKRDQLEVRRFEAIPDCGLRVDARAENRDYTFLLTIAGRQIVGTFETSRGANYRGRVEPVTP